MNVNPQVTTPHRTKITEHPIHRWYKLFPRKLTILLLFLHEHLALSKIILTI